MKRNYIHFIKYAICIGLPLLSSCSDDFLEPKALSFFEPTSTFTTREGLQAALTSCDRQAIYVFMGEGAPIYTDLSFLTSSPCHPKTIREQRCDPLMPFHEHGSSDSLFILRQRHLYCHNSPGKFEHLVHTHVYI